MTIAPRLRHSSPARRRNNELRQQQDQARRQRQYEQATPTGRRAMEATGRVGSPRSSVRSRMVDPGAAMQYQNFWKKAKRRT